LCVAIRSGRLWPEGAGLVAEFNYLVVFLSIVNLVVNWGFPFRLPYVHYLPDAISSLWGLGGAKLVTVVGFFGLLSLIKQYQQGRVVGKCLILCCGFNFLLPSYNIGIVAGVLALAAASLSSLDVKRVLVTGSFLGFVALLVGSYFVGRLDSLNMIFFHEFGMHPKVYSFFSLKEMFEFSPLLLLTGTGLGNFSGTAALWASEYLSLTSGHSRIELPGLKESALHAQFMAPALAVTVDDVWALSSTLNKPYTTVTTLVGELGLFMGGGLLWCFFRSVGRQFYSRYFSVAVVVFLLVIFFIDNLHTNPLFWGAFCIGVRGVSRS